MNFMNLDTPRIGVFLCRCGTYIGDFVDAQHALDRVKKLPNVICSEGFDHLCSDEELIKLNKNIKENNLNRIIIAACSSPYRKMLIEIACAEAGINPYLIEWVNIREQCAWAHRNEPEGATQKAIELIAMGVAKIPTLKPLLAHSIEIDENKCTGCGTCVRVCPFNAIQKDEKGVARVIEVLCVGCGMCGATCPEKAIGVQNFTDEQIIAQATIASKGVKAI